jgi:hypothetical protein
MNSTTQPPDIQNPHPVPITTGNWNRQRTVRPDRSRPGAEPTGCRFNWIAIGFWLGGLALGTGGCFLGASMPYRQPVGMTIAMLWWGIYLGCFGASIGAGVGGLFGQWWDHTPASPPSAGASGHRHSVQADTGAGAAGKPRSLSADRRSWGGSEAN